MTLTYKFMPIIVALCYKHSKRGDYFSAVASFRYNFLYSTLLIESYDK